MVVPSLSPPPITIGIQTQRPTSKISPFSTIFIITSQSPKKRKKKRILGVAHIAEMRDDEEAQKPKTGPTSSSASLSSSSKRGGSNLEGLFGRGKYKLWALTAITVLALWSLLTGSVTLKWSSVNLKHSLQDMDTSIHGDLDVLDVDEREKMVRQMWNVYRHSSIVRLPSFWRDAFGAAYQDLTSEVDTVRNAALLEIAKMSFGSHGVVYDPPPLESTSRLSKEDLPSSTDARKTRKQK